MAPVYTATKSKTYCEKGSMSRSSKVNGRSKCSSSISYKKQGRAVTNYKPGAKSSHKHMSHKTTKTGNRKARIQEKVTYKSGKRFAKDCDDDISLSRSGKKSKHRSRSNSNQPRRQDKKYSMNSVEDDAEMGDEDQFAKNRSKTAGHVRHSLVKKQSNLKKSHKKRSKSTTAYRKAAKKSSYRKSGLKRKMSRRGRKTRKHSGMKRRVSKGKRRAASRRRRSGKAKKSLRRRR